MINLFFFVIIFFFIYSLIKNLSFFNSLFIDKDFKKVQSFHNKPIACLGGTLIILSILAYSIIFDNNIINIQFLIFAGIVNFFIGILDDIKLVNNPIARFALIIFSNLFLILYYDFSINSFGVFFLDYLNQIYFFKYLLVLFALFFIINGSNLVDGFNGLLAIHSLILILILSYVLNETSQDLIDIKKYIYLLIISIICFLILNFPNAKIFLGDSGAYFLGSQIGIISIIIFNISEKISPFFISIILSYLFFEIFFSVFRKLFEKKNPFVPDGFHLHMLIHNFLKKRFKLSNPITSIFINSFFLILVLPSLFYYDKNLYCMNHFFIMILVYLWFYFYFRNKKT